MLGSRREQWNIEASLYLHYWIGEFLFRFAGRATDQSCLTAPDTNVRGTNSLKIITARSGPSGPVTELRDKLDLRMSAQREQRESWGENEAVQRRCYLIFNQFLWMLVNVRIPGWPVPAITHIYLGPEPHSSHLLSLLHANPRRETKDLMNFKVTKKGQVLLAIYPS